MRSLTLRTLGLLTTAIAVVSIQGAAPVRVQFAPTCPSCTIELTRVLSFGGISDSVLARGGAPVRDSRGRYYVAAAAEPLVLMYDSTGTLRRTIGKPGSGPGEFDFMVRWILISAGDTLFVFHGGNRVEVFSPEHQFVRQVRLPGPHPTLQTSVALLRNGFALYGNFPAPELIGFPLHVVDAQGKVIRSLDGSPDRATILTSAPPTQFQTVATASDGRSFWALADTGFTIRRFSESGELMQQLQVTGVPWLRPVIYYDTVMPGRGSGPPRTMTRARPHASVSLASVDESGHLWIASAVPGDGDPANGHPNKYGLHVFDPQTRTFIASQTIEQRLAFVAPGYVYTSVADSDGVATYTIWRVSLRGR